MWSEVRASGALFFGGAAFFASWIYCFFAYGFLLGLGLGWLPSIFVAMFVGYAWPVLVPIVGVLAMMIFADK